MRTIRLISLIAAGLLLAAFSSPAAAQIFPFPYEYSFSSAGAATVQIDFDMPDSLVSDPTLLHQVVYRDQNLTSWSTESLTPLYAACGNQTVSGQVNFVPMSGIMEWYLRSENDTAVVSQSPNNSGDSFPPPTHLRAGLGADPTGDAQSAAGNWLDLTHCYGSYSDTKLYFQLENAGGGFPTNQGLFTYFVYGAGVLDPDASDSSAYMLLYANVPAIFSPGLYRINLEDSSFTQIGSISTNISGNTLSMSCNISDLTSQPGWSEWPPPSGFIGVIAATGTQTLTDLTINDLGKAAVFQPKSNLLDYNVNNAPTLASPLLTDNGGGSVSAAVIYTDSDTNCPTLRLLHWADDDLSLTACDKLYETGATFATEITVSEGGWYSYWFEFSDGVETAMTDLDSLYVDLVTYIPGDANGDELVNITDAVYLISWIFAGGPAPDPLAAGDANCDAIVNITDAVYLINYIFNGGPAPCAE